MFTHYPFTSLGHINHGWLDARHHFSFGHYRNPERIGFGALLVINDDTVAPGTGFDTHPHRDMEIITYVRQGAITHEDSMGNVGRTAAGDVQVMSAGSGIHHAEYNRESIPTRLYQIWIRPNATGLSPRWDARQFPKQSRIDGTLPLLVSGRTEDADTGALFIHQDAAIYGGQLAANTRLNHPIQRGAYLLVSEGSIQIGETVLHAGDGAEISAEPDFQLKTLTHAELLLIEVPLNL